MKTTHRLLYLVSILITSVMTAQSRETIVTASYFIGGPEQLSYGPSALRIAPDGTFWIVNPADNTLTNVDRSGATRRQIDLGEEVVGITDLQFAEDGSMNVLDGSSEPPALLSVNSDGAVHQRKELGRFHPAAQRQLAMTDNAQSEPLLYAALSLETAGVVTFDGWRIRAGTDADPTAVLRNDSNRIEVRATRGVMRGLRILAETAQDITILAEEVADGDPITVDATVRRYARSGELLGVGRVPIADRYTHVETPVAVSNDGAVYMLRTAPGIAIISLLPLSNSIPEILPERREHDIVLNVMAYATATITRDQMETNARAFLNNSTYYNQGSLTGACAGRIAPRHLGRTPRNIGSVAYDWGGFDTVADYNRYIAAGQPAGDIDTRAEESCSRGVDCSGYVSRVWGLTSKKSTCSLSDVSQVITTQSLLKGDIMTRCGDHVVLFESFSSTTGINAYESTLYGSMDRVVYITSSWSRLSGYTPRRYNNVAVTPTTPSHMTSSASPSSGAPGMTATFASTWKNNDGTALTAHLTLRSPSGPTYDYTMPFTSGQTASGATFQSRITLPSTGRWDYAVTVTSTTTGRWARYPSSGFAAGPSVTNPTTYVVSPGYVVCGQYPVTIRAGAYLLNTKTVRFSITKGNNSCSRNGYFLAQGVVDIRQDSPSGPVVASYWYNAGAAEVLVDFVPNFTSGSRRYYATIRNQGFWAGPITVTAR